MKDIYLVNYSVKGIKTLDQLVSLSFYKKIIPKDPDTQDYNIKGIYGMNGTGKSGIVSSVEILKNLLVNPDYLSNPLAQKKLGAIINKGTHELFIEADYMCSSKHKLMYFRYNVILSLDSFGKYVISYEKLASKAATSKSTHMTTIFEVKDGEIISVKNEPDDADFSGLLFAKTANLLSTASICSLFFQKIFLPSAKDGTFSKSTMFFELLTLTIFGQKLHVYMDQDDSHTDYLINNSIGYSNDAETDHSDFDIVMKNYLSMTPESLNHLKITGNIVLKTSFEKFEKSIQKLYQFLHIFKEDLKSIEIDKKETHNCWVCDLIMVYDSYKVHAELESTGIKKLIRLFVYLQKMVQGDIVFIDEFDSNLHDIYLCALLEYLMEYGEGQLCFTTHNVGPMDVLRKHKKSIDFLSENHKIYPWTSNGNYSPSKLYRNGMIEGSPFNVDSIDFIGIFDSDKEDE